MTDTPEVTIRMTIEEYQRLPESSQITELINGELIVSPAPIDDHQKLVTRWIVVLDPLIENGELRVAPSDVYIDPASAVQPDVFWVSSKNKNCVLIDRYWHGAPDLIIEILSPSTALRDKDTKFRLYEKSGVREYWLVDPVHRTVEVYTLINGLYQRHGVYGARSTFQSPVLSGKIVDLKRVFL